MILFGATDDPHLARVAGQLDAVRAPYIYLDVWSTWSPLTFACGQAETVVTDASGCNIEIAAALFRPKPRLGIGSSDTEAFVLRERRAFLTALATISRSPAINHPVAQEESRNKLYQLLIAADLGLSVPSTSSSNDPGMLRTLVGDPAAPVIYKPLTWLATLDGRVLFTSEITPDDVAQHGSALRNCPGIYQERLPKYCEYRVTIIDDDVFSVRIWSQEMEDTRLDWRRNQRDMRYEVASIPARALDQLLAMLRRLGLRYGAIDLVEKPDGEVVFLEVNPAGNWLWLEDALDLPISRAIAAALLRRPGSAIS